MDMGATNEDIMTDRGQRASFSGGGSYIRGTVKGLGEGQWAPVGTRCSGFLPVLPLIPWKVLSWTLLPSVLSPSLTTWRPVTLNLAA